MMLVQVYTDTPMNGAKIRPAKISVMRTQPLTVKTMR